MIFLLLLFGAFGWGKREGSPPTTTAGLCVRTRGFGWEQRPYDAIPLLVFVWSFLGTLCPAICHFYSAHLVHPLISAVS